MAKFLLEERIRGENLIVATIPEIAKKTKLSQSTVKRIIKKLIEANFITRVQKGVYRINPAVIWRGNEVRRQAILIKFQNEKKIKEKDSGQGENAIPEPETKILQEVSDE